MAVLEQANYGQLQATIVQALRVGAALSLGELPLAPPPDGQQRSFKLTRFVVAKRDPRDLPARQDLYCEYDPREPWNRHLEHRFTQCEWGETNRTLLDLLLAGCKANVQDQAVLAQSVTQPPPAPATPDAAKPETTPPTAPPQRQPSTITIGIDPTQVQPRPTGGATSLVKAASRRADQR